MAAQIEEVSLFQESSQQPPRAVLIWLGIVCLTILCMIFVGGVTRLTHSGLSMVDWQPIMGIVPPLNEAEWQQAFEAYKQYPEYQQVNKGMSLEAFKGIFFWEYIHRVLGRLIGVLFFVPFVFFWMTGKLSRRLVPRLLIALVLGGAQGLMGWYMVMSGLVDMPRVSHYRLAAHLSLAMLILVYLFWIMLDLLRVNDRLAGAVVPTWLRAGAFSFLILLVAQIVWGAFVAGLRAGWGYNTFPDMNGEWMPEAVFYSSPWWINLFESNATVQFVHRWLGTVLLVLALTLWFASLRAKLAGVLRQATHAVMATTLLQYLLGVLTLLYVVPVGLGAVHQLVACFVLLAATTLVYVVSRRPGPEAAGQAATA